MPLSSATGLEEIDAARDDAKPAPPLPADAAVARKRAWGCGILVALALATPVLLVVGGYFGLYASNERLARQAIERASAAGDPVTAEEMNAYYDTSPQIEQATAHWLVATKIVEEPGFNQASANLPIFGPDREIAAGEYLAPEDRGRVADFLERYREAIEAARAAREAGAVARFPMEFEKGIGMLLPNAQGLRGVVRLLQLDLEANLAAGDVDAAIEDLLSMVAASESLSNEPILVSQLVRIACFGVAVDALENLLQRAELTDEQLARLQEAFGRQDFHDGLKRALRGEQWLLIHVMNSEGPVGDPQIDNMRFLPFRGADLAKGMEFWRETIDASDEGLLEALEASRAMSRKLEGVGDSSFDRMRYTTTLSLLPAVESASIAFLRAEANGRLADAAIACERYRLAHGDFPGKLEDLVPEYLPEVPLDPFDEQPLRYAVDEEGALLHSISQDQVDDGGVDEPVEGDVTFRLVLPGGRSSPPAGNEEEFEGAETSP